MPEPQKRSSVIELQRMAADGNTDIISVLRYGLIIATKLKINDFKRWIENELNGYDDDFPLPKYRTIKAQLKVHNPFRGYVPYHILDSEMADIFSTVNTGESISSIVSALEKSNENNMLAYPAKGEELEFLMNMQEGNPQLPVVKVVGKNQMAAIVDRARHRLLQFALDLEAEGILGEGIEFSETEKQKAFNMAQNINIGTFQGVMGDNIGGQINQSFSNSVCQNDINSLVTYLKSNNVPDEDIIELKNAISSDEVDRKPKSFGANVSHWIGKMIGKAASGAWDMSISAGGGLLEEALKKFYGL